MRSPAGGQFYEASRKSQLQLPARDFHSANYCGNLSFTFVALSHYKELTRQTQTARLDT
jgi:hypothetical protein